MQIHCHWNTTSQSAADSIQVGRWVHIQGDHKLKGQSRTRAKMLRCSSQMQPEIQFCRLIFAVYKTTRKTHLTVKHEVTFHFRVMWIQGAFKKFIDWQSETVSRKICTSYFVTFQQFPATEMHLVRRLSLKIKRLWSPLVCWLLHYVNIRTVSSQYYIIACLLQN